MKDTEQVGKKVRGPAVPLLYESAREFLLLNIVSILVQVPIMKSTNQRMDVCFSCSPPSDGCLSPVSPAPAASLLPFYLISSQLKSPLQAQVRGNFIYYL